MAGKLEQKLNSKFLASPRSDSLIESFNNNCMDLRVEGNAESSLQKEYHTKRELHKTTEMNVVHSLSCVLSVQILTLAFSLFLKLEGFRLVDHLKLQLSAEN